ncbi:S1 RNA-binding domain-containing protein [Flexistipes sp.]|nr:S1 RNA-binding domain-containing protein [Flexistipes sp.]
MMQENNLNNENNDNIENSEMDMSNFESMLEESLTTPARGNIVRGNIVQINGDDVLVNIGFKTEGIIDLSEFKQDGEANINVGDEVEAMIVAESGGGGHVRLSKKMLQFQEDWQNLLTSYEKEKPVAVKIVNFNDKGFQGKFGEVNVFILNNHIDTRNRVKKSDFYLNKVFNCKILKIDRRNKTALASRKLYLIESHQEEKEKFFKDVQEGDKLKGTVKTIKNYGAFVNLGPVDGFLHKNNISWGVVKHPGKLLEVDDPVEVKVLNVDHENNKIEVGIKQLSDDPWNSVREKYPEESVVSGNVVTRKRKGYVIEVEPGVDAIIPDEELSWVKSEKVQLNSGDRVEGKVLGYDDERKKIKISPKLLTDNPWNTLKDKHPEGSVVKGKVVNITDFGVFVDFGAMIDGLVRKSDISWTKDIDDLNSLYSVGDEIEAKILKIDPKRERISLGVKQLEKDPWREADKILPSGKVVEAEISEVNKDGVEVKLPRELKGFIPVKELDVEKVNPEEKFKAGETIKAVVLRVDKRKRNVLLSVKKYKMDSEKREVKEYMKQFDAEDSSFNLGNLIKDQIKDIDS